MERMLEDETDGPGHPLLAPLGHEGGDPEHAALQGPQTLQGSDPATPRWTGPETPAAPPTGFMVTRLVRRPTSSANSSTGARLHLREGGGGRRREGEGEEEEREGEEERVREGTEEGGKREMGRGTEMGREKRGRDVKSERWVEKVREGGR